MGGVFCAKLFRRLTHATAVLHERHDGADADQDVDDPFHLRPSAEEFVHEVPVCSDETADADQAPVNPADHEEYPADLMDRATLHCAHHRWTIDKIISEYILARHTYRVARIVGKVRIMAYLGREFIHRVLSCDYLPTSYKPTSLAIYDYQHPSA